ncbi:MAG TPA: hypothetical protein PKD72_02590, partial [Gemmatales bacterium]|nr:hypothetical protein [Gemmatales bacterium]
GVISNNPGNTVNDLPAWGGFVSFETSTVNWHFGINTAAPLGQTDFYSIALHEIGHALGLSVGFNQWLDFQSSATFLGPQAVAALNADNNSSATFLNQVSATNRHWQDGTHQSFIFSAGNPNLAGTVGLGVLQDLLMEPTANFTGSLRRFEVTNVEVGALQDLGWSVLSIPEPTTLALLGCLIVFTCYSYSQQQNKSASKPITADKSCITEQHYLSQV